MKERSRTVTLVLVDGDGRFLGTTESRTTAPPWWHDTGGVARVFPELLTPASDREAGPAGRAGRHAILRLLSAEPDETGHMGGLLTYLAQVDAATAERAAVAVGLDRSDDGQHHLTAHEPLRQPWAEPGGPSADLDWAVSVSEVVGPPTQHRTWNLSAIWSFPTVDGLRWLKCLPPFFAHEPAVLAIMADHPVPTLVADDRHRLLMADLPGVDGYDASESEQITMVETLIDLQIASAGRIDRLLAAGVPDLRTDPLIAELSDLVDRVAPGSRPLRRLVDELSDRLTVVADAGLPDVLVHGDPHPGNCRMGVDPPVWFDWGDSFIGNPLLDLGAVHRMSPAAIDRWLARWSETVGGSDLSRAWAALEPVALLRTAWVYQRFLDRIEPDERVYHRDDVPATLAEVERVLGR